MKLMLAFRCILQFTFHALSLGVRQDIRCDKKDIVKEILEKTVQNA